MAKEEKVVLEGTIVDILPMGNTRLRLKEDIRFSVIRRAKCAVLIFASLWAIPSRLRPLLMT